MNRFLVIPFDFCQTSYYSLILCKVKNEYTEYRITVMNGDLEKLLFGNNVMKEIDGFLHVDIPRNEPQAGLKMEIAKSLVETLKIPIQKSHSTE